MMTNPNLILVGFQSCGKTTVGKLIAEKIDYPFIDTDRLIEQYHPSFTCGQIFRLYGEAYFRHLESRVIQQLRATQESVIAMGGGAILTEANRLFFQKQGRCLYLKTAPAILKARLWSRPTLPAYLHSHDPSLSFSQIYDERALLYEQVAHDVVDMDHLTPDQAVSIIIKMMRCQDGF